MSNNQTEAVEQLYDVWFVCRDFERDSFIANDNPLSEEGAEAFIQKKHRICMDQCYRAEIRLHVVHRLKISKEWFDIAARKADASMKETQGHQFVTMLKTRCEHCGLSPKQAAGKKCKGWLNQFLSELSRELTGHPGAPKQ